MQILKPASYDGTGHWSDYKAHFNACAEINNWTEKEKGLYLAVSLRGQAQGVFGNLAKDSCKYDELAKAWRKVLRLQIRESFTGFRLKNVDSEHQNH